LRGLLSLQIQLFQNEREEGDRENKRERAIDRKKVRETDREERKREKKGGTADGRRRIRSRYR
jgi:hypothetical protein